MPTPVACLLNRPVMKFIFAFNGAIGSRLLPSSIPAPDPFAHQCCELMPLPMNNAAKRLGNGPGVPSFAGAAPQTGIDSSHGRAMATPTPRRNLRRESIARNFSRVEPVNGAGDHADVLFPLTPALSPGEREA